MKGLSASAQKRAPSRGLVALSRIAAIPEAGIAWQMRVAVGVKLLLCRQVTVKVDVARRQRHA